MSAWSRPNRRPAASLSVPSTRSCNLVVAHTAGLKLSAADRASLLHGRYLQMEAIAVGTFGQIMACRDLLWPSNRMVAVKMIEAKYDYVGRQERSVLSNLDIQSIYKLRDVFLHNGRYCLVFDLLGPPLSNSLVFAAQNLHRIRKIAVQLVGALIHLQGHRIIHADIKPDNILLISSDPSSTSSKIQLIDFGNSLRSDETSAYWDDFDLQSLHYRAPEIVFSMQDFGFPIDIWSVGCVLAELYCKRILFPADEEQDLLTYWDAFLGPIPDRVFPVSDRPKPFIRRLVPTGREPEPISARWSRISAHLQCRDVPFVSFISALLEYDPARRLTPSQALQHVFLQPLFPFRSVTDIHR